jgi:hypothetical protein
MRHEAAFAFEEDREITIQALRDVVGVEDRDLRGFGEPFAAHHPDIHPGDGENAGAAVGRGRHWADSGGRGWRMEDGG